jgi:hypothetical protein
MEKEAGVCVIPPSLKLLDMWNSRTMPKEISRLMISCVARRRHTTHFSFGLKKKNGNFIKKKKKNSKFLF